MDNEIRPAVEGCLLGRTGMGDECEDCSRCGWNPKVANKRKAERRRREKTRTEVAALQAARAHTLPDQNGWIRCRWALPALMERVIVTDGVFVGEAYLGVNGWTRFGAVLPSREIGVFGPVAWMPLPQTPGRKGAAGK